MEAIVLLCDFAEAVNGKLYIMGGGWTDYRGSAPINCSVAIKLAVPWTQTNQRHTLSLDLVMEDGEPVNNPENGEPIRVEGEFEVGRPPGAVPGSALVNAMAFQFGGLSLDPGGYKFSFSVDGTELAGATFRVAKTRRTP